MKIIHILEDDYNIRELIQMLLETQGYKVEVFANINEFWKMENENVPDLFLLDYMLPDGNGLEVCKNLKSTDETRDVPVILMSAHPNLLNMEGADALLPKPFDVDELVQLISSHI
ncbi:response regulator [Gramella sp. BOM4]|nr:response regulator [Christiangramia bathymodioli]